MNLANENQALVSRLCPAIDGRAWPTNRLAIGPRRTRMIGASGDDFDPAARILGAVAEICGEAV